MNTGFYGVGVAEMLQDQPPGKIWCMDDTTNVFLKENTMKKLFWVAVLYHKGKKTELVIEPEIMLAASEEKAKAGIINLIPASYKERFDRLEVVVRPF